MYRCLIAAVVVGLATTAAPAQLSIDVFPSIGPNSNGSPSFNDYAANAITGISTFGTPTGTPGTPSFYTPTPDGGHQSVLNILATDFPSWQGMVNPAPPFDGELGNQVYFGVLIRNPRGTDIRLSDLMYQITDTLDGRFSTTGDFSTADYSANWVGVINGFDGPTFVTSGSGTQAVNELWGIGVATGIPVSGVGSLAGTVNGLPGFGITVQYSITPPDREGQQFFGQATVNFDPAEVDVGTGAVPAPPGLWLGLIAIGGFAAARRRSGRTAPKSETPEIDTCGQ